MDPFLNFRKHPNICEWFWNLTLVGKCVHAFVIARKSFSFQTTFNWNFGRSKICCYHSSRISLLSPLSGLRRLANVGHGIIIIRARTYVQEWFLYELFGQIRIRSSADSSFWVCKIFKIYLLISVKRQQNGFTRIEAHLLWAYRIYWSCTDYTPTY